MTISTAASISLAIQSILSQFQAKSLALSRVGDANFSQPDNPAAWNNPQPRDSSIRSFSQSSTDVQADTPQTARSIGNLTGGKTRLNVVSALTSNDSVDFYSFNMTTAGKMALSLTSDAKNGVHVQIIKANGTVVADSEAKFGTNSVNFQDAAAGKLYLDKGKYILKVTRATGDLASTKPNYAMQLTTGKYFTEDYDTVEGPAAAASTSLSPIGAQNTANVSSVLDSLAGGNLFDFIT